MEGKTLVAVIRNNRNNIESIARNRQEIIETFDDFRLDVGDVITLIMCFMDNSELATIDEITPEMRYAVQNEGYHEVLQFESGNGS